MSAFMTRFIQRVSVLLIGVIAIYVAMWEVFPLFDHRIPLAAALLATYIVMAYLLMPAGARVWQLIVQPTHIPLYCVTPDGFASDPINIGIVGTREQVIAAMEQAGWFMADKRTPRAIVREIVSVVLRRPYLNAPFSTLYLFGHKQDLGFQQAVEGHHTHRHHVRFWACDLLGPEEFHKDVRFWHRFHLPSAPESGRILWIGAASKDIGIAPIRYNAQITHRVAADTNVERDLIVNDLQKTGYVTNVTMSIVGKPYRLRNRAMRSFLHSDGKLAVCELKN